MAALHEALKSLGSTNYADVPLDDLQPFLSSSFASALTICESVPLAEEPESNSPTKDSPTSSTPSAHSAAEISPSAAKPPEPPHEIGVLQKEWKTVKLNAKENPLGMHVYKAGAKDGKSAWFARRSVHEGLSFAKWKRALQSEFLQAIPHKAGGDPGAGNIRGIGGERLVESKTVEGTGDLQVYLLSAQFPGPTAPRDWVTLFLTSDNMIPANHTSHDTPRHFIMVSKPCEHPETQPRDGLVRGNYESIEFIREIRPQSKPLRASSAVDLPAMQGHQNADAQRNASVSHDQTPNIGGASREVQRGDQRVRGKTIAVDWDKDQGKSPEMQDDEDEIYPVEWIMITRSNPGGSIPRFMIERGTPASIVSDASKFLDYACSTNIEDFVTKESLSPQQQGITSGTELPIAAKSLDDTTKKHVKHSHSHSHTTSKEPLSPYSNSPHVDESSGGIYNMAVGAATAAGGMIAAYAPAVIVDNMPSLGAADHEDPGSIQRRSSTSSASSSNTSGSFASALDRYETADSTNHVKDGSGSTGTTTSSKDKKLSQHEKELAKLEERKRKLEEKFNKDKEKELHKKHEDTERETSNLRKVSEKHEKEVKKQEERYRKEMEKLERKKQKEAEKAEQRRLKALDKDDKARLQRELEEAKTRTHVLEQENVLLKKQVGDLQAENTALAVKFGQIGREGEDALRDFRGDTASSSSTSLTATVSGHNGPSSVRSSHDKKRSGSLSAMLRSPGRAGSVISSGTGGSSDTGL